MTNLTHLQKLTKDFFIFVKQRWNIYYRKINFKTFSSGAQTSASVACGAG